MKKAKKKRSGTKKTDVLSDKANFIIRHISLPLVILDSHGYIRNCNSGWLNIFGSKRSKSSDYVGTNYFNFLEQLQQRKIYSAKTKTQIEAAIKESLTGNSKPKHIEYKVKQTWYWSNINPMYSGSQFHGLVISHHDATPWKKKEFILEREKNKSLETSQRKMFFLANLNHELKSPLNAIIGFSELLKEHALTDHHLDGYRGLIENIVEGASHLKSIVFRILNMAKLQSGTLTLQEERVMPARLIHLALNIVQPLYPDRQIQIEICKEAAVETLKCDKNLTMEVLINLIVNSLKFSNAPIRIKCTVTKDRQLEFHVVDEGEGMTEEEVGVALEPFGQNIRSPHDKNTGLGLGVPFSSQIMKLHGGDLKIVSEKGKGTIVYAVFPSERIEI